MLNLLVTFFSSTCLLLASIMTLTVVLADAAMQIVPDEIRSHPQIRQYADRRGKVPEEVLLDRAFHHSAMKRLSRSRQRAPPEKMGRPDIVHNTLLQILETPLNWEKHLRVLVHTQDERIITVNPSIRLPKNYTRFVGLIEQLFKEGRVPQDGEPLLTVDRTPIQQVIEKIAPEKTVGFSTLGKPKLLRNVANTIVGFRDPLIFIGAFPRGHFSTEIRRALQDTYRVDSRSLDAWVVAGRLVYDFEWAIGVAQNRVDQ